MDKHMVVVFVAPAEARDDDLRKWYDEVHLPEVLQVPGVVGAQLHRLAAPGFDPAVAAPGPFLNILEIEGDPAAVLGALKAAGSGMRHSDALDRGSLRSWVYTPVTERHT